MLSFSAKALLGVVLTFSVSGNGAVAQVNARMFRFPDVSKTHIAFVYAGDIWVVEKSGGTASRLSSPAGEEQFPRFSPDGTHLAFSANYDGNTDVYVAPALGGAPQRVTYHPDGDRMLEWVSNDRLLISSSRESGVRRFSQLYTVAANGGLPEKLPVPYGESGAISDDGTLLAYTPKDRGFRTWKRYRGGMAPDIWLFNLASLEAETISPSDANDAYPMWHGDTIYFLSDRDSHQRSNVWAFDRKNRSARQVTRFTEFDVTFPSIGPDDIVFQAGGRLYLLDLKSEKYKEVRVEVVTDQNALRPRLVKVENLIRHADVSPTGKRALFEARGELFTVPAEHGLVRRLTDDPGSAELYPAWSPDGKQVAFWSDRSGEYELMLVPSDGGNPRSLTELGPGFRYKIFWSPDSRKLAFVDNAQQIRICDTESGTVSVIDRTRELLHRDLERFEMQWSKDGRWLAYDRALDTFNHAIFLFDTTTGESRQVTSGYYDDAKPVFDPEGRYLYYLTGRSLDPIYSDLDATWVYTNTKQIAAVPLRTDVPSPLAPRNDEERAKEPKVVNEDKSTKNGDANEQNGAEQEEKPAKDAVKEVEIDFERFEARAVLLPPSAGVFETLRAAPGKVIYQRGPRKGSDDKKKPVIVYDLEKREEETILEDVDQIRVSADSRKLLVSKGDKWHIVDVKAKQKLEKPLTTELEVSLDPRQEWAQIFNDVWRLYRDYFYDPAMHGVDWEAMRKQYSSLIPDAATRWDVTFVLGELIGEVNASHTYVGGGDTEKTKDVGVGLLGVNWKVENGAYRIDHIVEGGPWDIDARSPLREPGIDVNKGDYVLAVNGRQLDPAKDPYGSFQGLAEKTVALTVNSLPTAEGAREVLVKTLESEARLRNLEWIETIRRKVDEASDGRIGYAFVPNTGISGQTELVRQFRSQIRKEGLIIDERFNAGGQLADRFIEMMTRPLATQIFFRNGAVRRQPEVTHFGPKAMLINGWAGSGGDAFPWFFRTMKVGPIIGERTWGGLIGPAVGHQLVDGGRIVTPPGRLFGPDGKWFAEGHGVDPDIIVVDDPAEMARGRDPQLERAIQEVLRLLDLNPPKLPEPPAFERRISESASERRPAQ